jgi:hypothetical protein
MLLASENVHYKNLDVLGSGAVQTNTGAKQNLFTLCGFVGTGNTIILYTGGNVEFLVCGFSGGPVIFSAPGGAPILCTFLNVLAQQTGASATWKGFTNVFIGCRLYLESTGSLGSTGLLRMYDTGAAGSAASSALLQASTGSNAWIESMVGEGNTVPLVLVDRGSQVRGAANITATTSATAYSIDAVAYSSTTFNSETGNGVFN